MTERTLVLIKPDAMAKNVVGEIIKIYEANGLKIAAMKMMNMTERIAALHYEEHIGRPYYDELVAFMTSAPIIAMVLTGEDAISKVRKINGKTNPKDADEGTIRKLFAENGSKNAVHASDSPESAKRETAIFFAETEIFA